MTEVGTLEIHCVSSEDAARRWLLEFQLRGDDGSDALASRRVLPARFADAVQCIERIFGASSQPVDSKEVRRLRGSSSICSANATTGRCRCCARCSTP
jgi:hypothetical protein